MAPQVQQQTQLKTMTMALQGLAQAQQVLARAVTANTGAPKDESKAKGKNLSEWQVIKLMLFSHTHDPSQLSRHWIKWQKARSRDKKGPF